MHFGLRPEIINMKLYKILIFAAIAAVSSCKDKTGESGGFKVNISPAAGAVVKSGTDVPIKVSYAADLKPDSVVYLLDSLHLAVKKDSSVVTLKTDTLKLGVKTITVKVYSGGKSEDAATNISLVAAKAPELLTYKVEKVYPHDTSSFTEGLEYHDGVLYESDGGYAGTIEGSSSLRKVNLTNGKVMQMVPNDAKVFAEGITVIDGKIIQLTYHEKVGFVYDQQTMKLLKTFPFNAGPEGWGLTNDGKQLYVTIGNENGTNQVIFLDKNTYQKKGSIEVYDDKGPVTDLNELEYIDGKLYANIWNKDVIVVINPKIGAVEQRIDMSNIYPAPHNPNSDVLNGIAWDAAGKRLFVTGKKWPHLYQITLTAKK